MPISNQFVEGSRSITIDVPNSTHIRNVKGKPVYWDLREIPESFFATLLVKCSFIKLTNTFNSGGKDRPDEVRLDALTKAVAAFDNGSWEVIERATNQATLMREAYRDFIRQFYPDASDKRIDDDAKEAVKAALGADTNATIDNVIRVTAMSMAADDDRTVDEIEAQLTADFEAVVAKKEAERAKQAASASKIDFSKLQLAPKAK